VVYAATAGEDGASRLFRQRLDRFEAEAIEGTAGANDPFFSPDGRWLGFRQGDALRRLDLESGAVGTILEGVGFFYGASWGADDTLVVSDLGRGLMQVPVGGGTPRILTEPDERGLHRSPEILPGGKRAIFSVGLGAEQRLAVLTLATGEWHTLEERGGAARYVPGGHLAFGGDDPLRVVEFDAASATIAGDPVPVVDDVFTMLAAGAPFYAVSPAGTLAYVLGRPLTRSVWVDREGRRAPFEIQAPGLLTPSFSPDGGRVAARLATPEGRIEVWILDLEAGSRSPLLPSGRSFLPVWSPDGSALAFMSSLGGGWHMGWKALDGSGRGGRIAGPGVSGELWVTSWHPDGGWLVISSGGSSWITTLEGKPELLWQSPHNERGLTFHPDGEWVAFTSDSTGRSEIYARSFPDGEQTFALSADGGVEPAWSADGTELFYRDGDRMMVVPIALDPFRPGRPRVLFTGHYAFTEEITKNPASVGTPNYAVTRDGQRFLMIEQDEASLPRRIHVVVGWAGELGSRNR